MCSIEDTYRLLFESSMDAMLLIEGETFIDCNQAALDMLGYDNKEEMLSAHPSDFSPPVQPDGRSSFEKINDMIATALKNDGHRFDWLNRRKSGDVFPAEVTLTPLRQGDKALLHVIWRDVTFHKKMESSFQNYHKHLEKVVRDRTRELRDALDEVKVLSELVNQTTSSIMMTDANGVIEYVNPAFSAFNGYSKEEALGKTPAILSSGKQDKAFYQQMWQEISAGNAWEGSLQNRRKDGSLYWVQLKISPIKNDAGEVEHFVGVEDDITELVAQRDIAEKANRAKSDYLVSMSNSLRTPLNAIVGFGQLLEMSSDNPLNGDQRGLLDQILSAGRNLDKVLDEVIDMAKVESQTISFLREMVHSEHLILGAVSDSFPLAQEYDVHLDCQVADNIPGLMVDSLRFKQVLRELLANAIKFNQPNGKVMLAARMQDENTLHVEISDTGIGIAEQDRDLVFQPFQRLVAPKSDIPGLGLGLAKSKGLVEAMGGQLDYTSTELQGSCFWFTLPVE